MGILPGCKDPALTALKSIGYNVVQLARVDMMPTQLLVSSNKRLKRLGDMSSLFSPGDAAPPIPLISPDRQGPNIAITKSAALDIGVGLNILGGLISALGGSTLGLSLAYAKASKIELEYSGTKENAAQLTAIDQFLAGAKVNAFAQAARDMLEADMVYVVTSTLKASKLSVTASDSHSNAIGIDVPVLQGAVGGNLKIGASGAGNTKIEFAGEVPLVFAFQAVRLIFDHGKYRTMKLIDGGSVTAEAVAPDPQSPWMAETDSLLVG